MFVLLIFWLSVCLAVWLAGWLSVCLLSISPALPFDVDGCRRVLMSSLRVFEEVIQVTHPVSARHSDRCDMKPVTMHSICARLLKCREEPSAKAQPSTVSELPRVPLD